MGVVTIDELSVSKSGYFYRVETPITDAAIEELFRAVRKAQSERSQNHFCHVREKHRGALWSAICFSYKRAPSFLVEGADVQETVCGYMLLVEYDKHLAIFKSQLEVASSFVAKHLQRISSEMIDASVTDKNSVFEKLRLRNMTVSRLALRSKTLEAGDLSNSVGPASSSRFAPLAYGVKTGSEYFSATPRTGRISQRSDRGDHHGLVDYVIGVVDRMNPAVAAPVTLLSRFARALELSSITSRPTLIAIDTAELKSALFDPERRTVDGIRFVKKVKDKWKELAKADTDIALAALATERPVEGVGKVMDILDGPGGAKQGSMALNKSRIALKTLDLPEIADIEVESLSTKVGEDLERIPLREFIDRSDAFIVLFDKPQYAYIDGTLYQDDAMLGGGAAFLKYFIEVPGLNTVVDEKGAFVAGQTAFDNNTTFAVVVGGASKDDDFLVCDDLGDEWADFVGVNSNPLSPRVTFYHAKHGPESLGASPFHISVSQAIKNLGRFALQESELTTKFTKWRKTYRGDRVTSDIARVCRGNQADLEAVFEKSRNAPHLLKRVAIVTSSLSKAKVKTELEDMQKGVKPTAHFIQLYWLLASFFSACAEVGAVGCVICKP